MKRAHAFASILLLTLVSFAQQPSNNPQDRSADRTDQTYSRQADQTYNRAAETGHNWGGWGLLGLIGLAGLLGRGRRETISTGTGYTRDDRTYGQQRRVG